MKAWLKASAIACAILIAVGAAGAGAVLASPSLAQDVRAVSSELVEVWVETALTITQELRA